MILDKLKEWAIGLAALLAAIGAAVLYGREKGKASVAPELQAAKDQAASAQEAVKTVEVRQHVEQTTASLPDAPTTPVATAPVDSAAGKLSADWSRD